MHGNGAFNLHLVGFFTDNAVSRFSCCGKSFGKQIVQRFALFQTGFVFGRFVAQLIIAQRLHFIFMGDNLISYLLKFVQFSGFFREQSSKKGHKINLLSKNSLLILI